MYKNPELLVNSDFLVLPGVGAFKPAMKLIKKNGFDEMIFNHVKRVNPLLGICLGMQLLGLSSSEMGYIRPRINRRESICNWTAAMAYRLNLLNK